MTDKRRAVQDLNWLAERLKGIIALGPDMTNHDTLVSQTTELTAQIDQQHKAVADLNDQHKEATKKLQSLKDSVSTQEQENQDLKNKGLAEATQASEEIKKQLTDQHLSIKQDLDNKIDEATNQLQAKYRELDSLNVTIKETAVKKENLLNEFKALKEKF